ncbi:MAG TPA: DNA repair protein RecO [Verrucomicrobiota bacterium]|nr:DNA repair protein RecO [Opitutales bacterium]HJN90958.1 DNA repair protein RecO [Verrucomicrobiota bacterium]
MDERATGLVLRVFPLTETSLVVHWLSPGFGRIGTVAKGARRPKSPFRGKIDLFHLAEFSFRRSRRSDLHTLCELALQETFPKLRTDVGLLDCLARATKLLNRATEEQTPLRAEFDLMLELVRRLDGGGAGEFWLSVFEVKFLASQGQEPDWANTKLDAGTRAVAAKMASAGWTDLAKLRPSETQLRRLAGFLEHFIRHHVGVVGRLAKHDRI